VIEDATKHSSYTMRSMNLIILWVAKPNWVPL